MARSTVTLRPAVDADVDAIASIWHRGWRDGHQGHVPAELERERLHMEHFRDRVPSRLPTTTVAVTDDHIVGFVVVRSDEIEQIYVDKTARGAGVADRLLRHGEILIGEHFDWAWLAVVPGNARARRFYERNGWADTGALAYPADTTAGVTILVPVQRYEKYVAPAGTVRRVSTAARRPLAGKVALVAGATAALTPGWLRSEAMLDAFGVTEAYWRDATERVPHFAISETPAFVGRAVVALASDPEVARWNGHSACRHHWLPLRPRDSTNKPRATRVTPLAWSLPRDVRPGR